MVKYGSWEFSSVNTFSDGPRFFSRKDLPVRPNPAVATSRRPDLIGESDERTAGVSFLMRCRYVLMDAKHLVE